MSHANHHNREKHKQNTSKGKRRTADNHHRPSPRVDELSADNEHKVVGQYLVGKTIGEGTFGKVKLAIHIPTGEKVAVKVLEKSRIKEPADVRRVNREIKILKRAKHGNVIQLYEVLDTKNSVYLIMENADGGEMFDYIVAHRHVPEMQACNFFHQIINGLEHLHINEITHRDLKPENLLLKESADGWVVKIVDFGLSNTHEGGKFLSTACGSPCYAAPEMIAGKKYFGPMADMWSMGVILFALVCGYLPFEDQNTSILYKKILSGRYSAPDWISMGVRDLIRKILETDPLKRFSIRDVRKHPWYAIVKDRDLPHDTLSISDNEHLKAEALSAMRTAGLDVEATVEALKSKTCNALTANYYLFFQKSRAQCNYVIKIEDLTHLPQESAQELLEQQLSAKGPSKQPSPQPQAPTTEPPSAARPVRVAPLKSAKNEIAIATEEQPVKDGDKVVEELEVSEVKSAKLSPKPPLRADNNVADASRRASDAFNSPFPAAAIKQREEVPSSKSTTVRATQHEHRPSKPDITKPDLQPVRKYSGPSSKSTHLKHHNPSKQNSSQGLKECNAPLELVSISNAAAKLRQYQDHQKRLETQLLLKEIEQNKRVEQLLPKSDVKSIPTKVDDIKATAVPVETKISYLNSKPQPSKASANRNGSSDGNGAEDVLEKRVSITNGSITNDDNNDQAEVVTKMARLQFKKEGGNEFLNERMWPLVETVKTEPAPEPMEVCTNVDVAEDNDGRPSTRRNSRTKKDAGKEIIAREVQASGKLDTEPIVTVNNKKHPLKSDGDDDNDKQLEIRGTKPVEQPMPTKPIGNTNTSGHNLGRGRYGRNIISVNHRNSV